ncbi:cytochrome b562 [Erwinia persicina]|uniref:Cytochrome b562 n=1 Tax=Erwinia persicina TaxID=55211 RepID=A0A3Q8HKJ9_9GAMM|nr:cytochrome b562 [Erwinia persicina]AXU96581.1 cytochrome B562 [Erwinia persicina]MBC3944672.1 cytochrome b562 [Erwinia persicina]MBD8106169.1 cytochrome b562 [Erwinia persicina]MBD8168121.1 cytochrome b562 [Erwinia persicina]MBD8208688.1 cytochrome b562 [Erwinia persicina]
MRKLWIAMLSSTLLFSSTLLAQGLEGDMDILKGAYRTVQKTDDKAEMVKALTDMRSAAENAKTQTPDKLEGQAAGSAEMKDYRAQLDKLIGQIDTSLKLANSGDLSGAKEEAKKFAATRDEGHKKFR